MAIGIRKWSGCLNKIRQKGYLYEEDDSKYWDILKTYRKEITVHFAEEGLKLDMYDADGFARLNEITEDDTAAWIHAHPESSVEFEYGIPSNLTKTQYSLGQAIVLVILRQKMQTYREDMTSDICLISRQEIWENYAILSPEKNDEIKVRNSVDRYINDMCDDGYIRPVADSENDFEVRKIIEYRITVEKLKEFAEALKKMNGGEEDV